MSHSFFTLTMMSLIFLTFSHYFVLCATFQHWFMRLVSALETFTPFYTFSSYQLMIPEAFIIFQLFISCDEQDTKKEPTTLEISAKSNKYLTIYNEIEKRKKHIFSSLSQYVILWCFPPNNSFFLMINFSF
jgi:hypothetical protein